MKFAKFTILKSNEAYQQQDYVDMLINLEHVVSIKPIKMTTDDNDLIDGYWLRLSNGKKYRSLSIPEELKTELFKEVSLTIKGLSRMPDEDHIQ